MQGRARVVPDAAEGRAGASWRRSRNHGRRNVMESIRAAFADQGLYRARDGRVLGGVVAGLGRRLGLEPWPARLLFVLALMLIPGSQLLVYPILWVLMPEAGTSFAPPSAASPSAAVK